MRLHSITFPIVRRPPYRSRRSLYSIIRSTAISNYSDKFWRKKIPKSRTSRSCVYLPFETIGNKVWPNKYRLVKVKIHLKSTKTGPNPINIRNLKYRSNFEVEKRVQKQLDFSSSKMYLSTFVKTACRSQFHTLIDFVLPVVLWRVYEARLPSNSHLNDLSVSSLSCFGPFLPLNVNQCLRYFILDGFGWELLNYF